MHLRKKFNWPSVYNFLFSRRAFEFSYIYHLVQIWIRIIDNIPQYKFLFTTLICWIQKCNGTICWSETNSVEFTILDFLHFWSPDGNAIIISETIARCFRMYERLHDIILEFNSILLMLLLWLQ